MTTTERRHRLHCERDTSATYEQLALMEKDDMTMRNLFKSTNPNAKGNRIATGLIVGSLIGLALLPDPANAAEYPECPWVGKVAARMALIER